MTNNKTTLVFSDSFVHMLKHFARKDAKSMSRFIEEELREVFRQKKRAALEKSYSSLRELLYEGKSGVCD